CWPVAEDSHVPPLPRRAPDDKRRLPGGRPGWGSGLTQPLALPESLRQRIRAALDYGEDEAPAPEHVASLEDGAPPEQDAPSENGVPPEYDAPLEKGVPPQAAEISAGQPASLPRRVPGANNGPEPPAHIARPAMLPSLVHPRSAPSAAAVPAATLGAIAAAAGTPANGPRPPGAPPRPPPPLTRPPRPPGPAH